MRALGAKSMKANKPIPADQYFRELEAWGRSKERKDSGGRVIDFLEAKRRRAANRPPSEVDRSNSG